MNVFLFMAFRRHSNLQAFVLNVDDLHPADQELSPFVTGPVPGHTQPTRGYWSGVTTRVRMQLMRLQILND